MKWIKPTEQKQERIPTIERWYVADFETLTTNTEHFMSGKEPVILCFAIQELNRFNDFVVLSNKMEDFEKWLLSLKYNSRLFFHNLAFDGLVIADWARYRWNSQAFKVSNSPFYWTYQSVKGKILSITIIINDKIYLSIQCSLRLLNQSVAALGKIVGLPKLEVETYDLEPTDRLDQLPPLFIEYLKQDVLIVNKALIAFKNGIEKLNKEFGLKIKWDKPTSASISRDIINAVDSRLSFKVHIYEQQKAAEYYRGGFTAINQDFKDQVMTGLNGMVFDAKSHYPSVIYLNNLPHQKPLILNKNNDFDDIEILAYEADLKAGRINLKECLDFVAIKGKIKQNKSGWGSIVWPKEIKDKDHLDLLEAYIVCFEPTKFEFKGTVREWNEAAKFYEFLNWEITELVLFNKKESTDCLKQITNYLYKTKEQKDKDGNRPWAMTFKIILNSLYGSMGMDENFFSTLFLDKNFLFLPKDTLTVKNKNAKERLYYDLQKDNLNFFQKGKYQTVKAHKEFWEEELKPDYWNRWIAAYITSIGRAELMRLIAMDFNNIWYCDTDSLIGDLNNKAFIYLKEEKLIGDQMGQWQPDLKPEQTIYEARFRAPKNYDLQDKKGNILKRGNVGIDKTILEELEFNEKNFLDWNTTIKDGWKHIVYGIYPEDFKRDSDGIVRLIPFNERLEQIKARGGLHKKDSFYPYIINQDKQLSKLARQRARKIENEQNRH